MAAEEEPQTQDEFEESIARKLAASIPTEKYSTCEKTHVPFAQNCDPCHGCNKDDVKMHADQLETMMQECKGVIPTAKMCSRVMHKIDGYCEHKLSLSEPSAEDFDS